MNQAWLLLLSAAVLSACSQEAGPARPQQLDPVLVKARALQALVCLQLHRVPQQWKSDVVFRSPSAAETWETLSDQPLMDHARKVSSVYSRTSGKLYLVLQEGLPETVAVYGPIPEAPQCSAGPEAGDS